MHMWDFDGEITCISLHDIVQRNVMHLCEVSVILHLPNHLCTESLALTLNSSLFHNASLVNNVPLLIKERWLIEQISAGWAEKPCQVAKSLQINMMQCIPHIGLSCVLH